MSSPGSPSAGNRHEPSSRRGSDTVWHPAREWLEGNDDEDERDLDYQPWSDEDDMEDIWEEEDAAAEQEDPGMIDNQTYWFYRSSFRMVLIAFICGCRESGSSTGQHRYRIHVGRFRQRRRRTTKSTRPGENPSR